MRRELMLALESMSPKLAAPAPAPPPLSFGPTGSPLDACALNALLPGFASASRTSAFSAVLGASTPCSSFLDAASPPSSIQTTHAASSPLAPFLLGSVGSPQPQNPVVSTSALVNAVQALTSAQTSAPSAPLLLNQLMCLPGLLNPNLGSSMPTSTASGSTGGHSVPSAAPTTAFKPIPNTDNRVDLVGWRVREPIDWTMDDVVGWMLETSKRLGVPCEDINMSKFATLSGAQLLKMNESDFVDCDPAYGKLFYREMARLLNVTIPEESILDDVLRKYKEVEDVKPVIDSSTMQFTQFTRPQGVPNIFVTQQQITQTLANNLRAQLTNNLCAALNPNGISFNNLASTPLLGNSVQRRNTLASDYLPCFGQGPSTSMGYESEPDSKPFFARMRPPMDGKIRKRSTHAKGNKLWEFIRDALKDPATCPSVVRWEDPNEGVFRIVESEKLARLWGERKNNTKMTYEKLSRAMRTYYDKQILMPVPKTGLYPKKLVYKFGPAAHGWSLRSTVSSA